MYRRGGHLFHVTGIMLINFHFHVTKRLQIEFGKKWPSGFLERQVYIFICK